jgi:hypothetical protein
MNPYDTHADQGEYYIEPFEDGYVLCNSESDEPLDFFFSRAQAMSELSRRIGRRDYDC